MCFDKDSNFVRPEIIINKILGYINEHNLNYSEKHIKMYVMTYHSY
mgnify:CR=1 FL=1